MRKIGTALLGVAALVIWLATRMTWLTVSVYDDKSGDATHNLVGAVWSTEMTAVALLLVASAVATLVLRRMGRRVVAVVAALAAAAASWKPVELLLYGANPQRVKDILTTGTASQQQNKPISVTSWAEITDITVAKLALLVTILGCIMGLFGALLILMKPGEDGPRKNTYEVKKAREERLHEDLSEDPDSPRLMWDAMDADIDPTSR